MNDDLGWSFNESKLSNDREPNALPPWGRRRAPMPTERVRFNYFRQVPLLQHLDERVLWSLAYEAVDEMHEPGTIIIREGDENRDMRFYLIREGDAFVSTTQPLDGAWKDWEGMLHDADGNRVQIDPRTGGHVLAKLTTCDFFGESALLTSQHRSASVRAGSEGLHTLTFDAQTFHTRIAEHVLVFRMVRSQHADSDPGALDVRRLGLFNDLPLRDLSAVLHDARQETFQIGDAIVTQGDRGERFYVILEGEVMVEKDDHPVARLARGDFFGETALMLDCPRTATVRALRHTQCWSITREAFELVLRHYLLGHRTHGETIRQRFGRAS